MSSIKSLLYKFDVNIVSLLSKKSKEKFKRANFKIKRGK